jgi:hypothetical protein
MRGKPRSEGSRLVRITLLAAGVLALAGCASGYSFVQPDTAGAGDYYTSGGPYPAPGHYYDDTAYDPYDAGFGYGGLYGPSFAFGLGFGNVCGWSCGDYYGGWPWYYGGVAYHGKRWHHGHRHGDHGDSVASGASPHPWRRPDHATVPPNTGARGTTPPIALPEQPMEGVANRRVLDSASFAPRGTGRMPRLNAVPDPPASMASRLPAFADRPMPVRTEAPRVFSRPAAPAPGPIHVASPPVRSSQAPATKIR